MSPKDNDSLRSPEFIDHLTNPRNVGELEGANAVSTTSNPVRGDELKLSLRVEEGRIVDARFKAYGCAAALAASSLLTELLIGKTVEEARAVTSRDIAEGLGGLPPHKLHAGDLAEDAIHETRDRLKS
ncbi:MAG: iron-sulfur cluster assembly scaffold protein [Nitrospinota bacterium]